MTRRSGRDKRQTNKEQRNLFCSASDNTTRLHPVSATSASFARYTFQKVWATSQGSENYLLVMSQRGSKMAAASVTTPAPSPHLPHAVLGKTLLSFIPYLMVGKLQQSSKVNRFSKAAANPGLNMWFFQRTLSTHTRKTLLLLLHACSAHCQAATCVASTQHLPMQSGQMNEMTDIESDLVFQRVPVS